MNRRKFAALAGAAAAWPLPVRAQQAAMPVVGYLGSDTPERFASRLSWFLQGLRAAGFEDGRNVTIAYRWANGHIDRLPALAADLVRLRVAVIVAPGNIASALAAKAATATIPIVFETGADPVALGLVASLSRPGGNITGVTSLNVELAAKRLEQLRELLPAATSFALLVNQSNPNAEPQVRMTRAAAGALRLEIHVLSASAETDFDGVFAAMRQRQIRGLVIGADLFFAARSKELAALAARHAVPAIHQSREFAVAGGLMSLGGVVAETHRQAGVYAGRILKGEKPADLPVQQVTRFELIVNLRAAKALGIAVPPAMLLRADEVIE